MIATPEVTFVLPDKFGGVFNMTAGLLAQRRPGSMACSVVLTDNAPDIEDRSRDPLQADRIEKVRFSLPPENLRSVLKRVAAAIRPGPGVLVANDWIELACATVHNTERAVIAIAHGDSDHYYNLAVINAPAIDAWIAVTARIQQRLREVIPDRAADIHLIPFGVAIPTVARRASAGRLRAIYVGRISRDKGVLDLPAIDRLLRDRHIDVAWTVVGSGPEEIELRSRWRERDVAWKGYLPGEQARMAYQSQDILVLPSRSEGLPVVLLEAGAAGVVPVVSNLPSGVPEIVVPGDTGFRPPVGDVGQFAEAIARLDGDRQLLEQMSRAVRDLIASRFEARARADQYFQLFERWADLRRPRRARLSLAYGSRLDKPWLPNPIVRAIRSRLAKPQP